MALVFGYGSLLFRADFPHESRRIAVVHGWIRRFEQGSPDHRGTPEFPGRVVTLLPQDGAACIGAVFEVSAVNERAVLAALDCRERGGYERTTLDVELRNTGEHVRAVTWVAPPDNAFYLGPASLDAMVEQMATAAGPSGSNAEYVLQLARVLVAWGLEDPHVEELAARLRVRTSAEAEPSRPGRVRVPSPPRS